MNNSLSETLNNVSSKQTLLDLMDLSLESKVKLSNENSQEELPGTGFFVKEDLKVQFYIDCRPGEMLNYWRIMCLGIKGMGENDRLHYYRTVMQIDKRFVSRDLYGDWEKMKEGYSRGISYGLDQQGHVDIYILDYSIATGKGFFAKLTSSGASKRHEEFAYYPFLSARKSLIYNKLLDVYLPKCYFDDSILRNTPLTVYDGACSVEFKGQGIAHGTLKEQAYESLFPVLINKPNAKFAVSIVATIEITATLLIGERGGRIIKHLEREYIETNPEMEKYVRLLSDKFKGFLPTLYNCDVEGVVFKKCGMTDDLGQPVGVVYFIG